MDTDESPAAATPGRPLDAGLTLTIRDAVVSLLGEAGYARMSMAKVAQRAGVSTATLYRRWPSKRDLLLDVATALASDELGDIDTGALYTDLVEFMQRRLGAWQGERARTLFSLLGEAAYDPEVGEVVHRGLFAVARSAISVIMARAQSRGELASHADPAVVIQLVFGAQLVYSGSPLLDPELVLPDPVFAAHSFAGTIVAGIGSAQARGPRPAHPSEGTHHD